MLLHSNPTTACVTGHGMLPNTNRTLSTGKNYVKAAHDTFLIEKLRRVIADSIIADSEVKTTEH